MARLAHPGRRRKAAIAAGACLVLIAAGWHWYQSQRTFPRANLLLFSIDTLRADHLSGYGYRRLTSPRFDALLAESVRFTDCWSQAPETAPSHMTMFTGMMPIVHDIRNQENDTWAKPLLLGIPTLPERLHWRGYRTLALTGDAQIRATAGFGRGFDRFYEDFYPGYATSASPEEAADRQFARLRQFLGESREQKKPWFVFMHHYLCHDPYQQAPAGYARKFADPATLPAPLRRWFADQRVPVPSDDLWANVDLADSVQREAVLALYDGGIAYSDALLGRLIDMLRAENLLDETILVVTSDHGEEFYEHGGYSHGSLYPEHLRVPLAIRFPGAAWGGRTIDAAVRLVDLLPTLFSFLQLTPKVPFQGESFRPLIAGNGIYQPLLVSYRTDRYTEFDPVSEIRVASREYALIRNLSTGSDTIFSRVDDPQELVPRRTVAAPERIAELRARAEQQLAADRKLRARLLATEPHDD